MPLMTTPGGMIQTLGTGNSNMRANNTRMPAGFSDGQQGYTREVQANETAAHHLQGYTDPNNPYVRRARARGAASVASHGGLALGLGAAAAEGAALDAAAPLAMFDAGQYSTAAGQNLDSLGQQRISAEGNATQLQSTSINAGTNYQIARERNTHDREFARERRGWDEEDRDLSFGREDRHRGEDRDWSRESDERRRRWDVDDRNYNEGAQQRRNREGARARAMDIVMSDPSLFRDPEAARRFVEFWGDVWDDEFPVGGGG